MKSETSKNTSVGVIGLGLLGTALAERLLGAGFPTVVHNRSKEKAASLLDAGAVWSDNPLQECDRVVVCLYTTETVEAVLEDMAEAYRPGLTLIDTTTGNPNQTESLGKSLAEVGVQYLESPIAASSEQTRQGEAVALVAGVEDVYRQCLDIYAAIAPKSFFLGTWGNAAKVKLVNNLVLGLNRLALAEGLVFAETAGLDAAKTLEVLKQGNSYSVVMDVKGAKMLDQDFAPQGKLTQHLKDVRIILKEARANGLSLPVSQLHAELLASGERLGYGESDNSAIVQVFRENTPTDQPN